MRSSMASYIFSKKRYSKEGKRKVMKIIKMIQPSNTEADLYSYKYNFMYMSVEE